MSDDQDKNSAGEERRSGQPDPEKATRDDRRQKSEKREKRGDKGDTVLGEINDD